MVDFFGGEEDRAEREATAAGMASFLESLDHSHKSQITLALCLFADLAIFAAGFFFPSLISNLNLKGIVFLILVLFTVGFLAGFAAHKMLKTLFFQSSKNETIDRGIMSGYAYSSKRMREARVWLVSAATGVLNVVLMLLFFDSW